MSRNHGEGKAELEAVVRDPVRFAHGLLRADLWGRQAEILRSVASNRRTAVKACHGSGKSYLAAAAVLWWIMRYRDGIVVTTAPTWTQIQKVLWGEIHAAIQRGRINFPQPNRTELRLGPSNYAIGLSTNEGVRFQGFHGGHILIVLDEAPGVLPEIWEAIEGIRAGGQVHVLALGNPTISSGPFYDAFTCNRDGWSTYTISAFDSPNLAGLTLDGLLSLSDQELDVARRPYLVTRRWVREKWYEWGEGHPLWEARVLGQFPAQADNALISLAWLEEAARRSTIDSGGKLRAGIDVAGPGEDETVLAIVDGSSVVGLHTWTKSDPRGEVANALAPYRVRLETVNVDSAGIGYYFGKHLQDLGYPVRLVNVGRTSSKGDKYANLKAEYYWGLRMRFQDGDVAGLTDEQAIAQLSSILYEHDARGRVVIESKEDARKRGVRSPDRAEALMLAFARPTLGWTLLADVPDEEKPESPTRRQLEAQLPALYHHRVTEYERCGTCVEYRQDETEPHKGFCKWVLMLVAEDAYQCESYMPRAD